ncbi:hypothetical protein [Streptomyces sp. NPDC088847]|uniref:hypothetical protein n=1 Tax=Streptomyces sp. NPDC088847 TaxID=3365909 RepID=UPI0038055846
MNMTDSHITDWQTLDEYPGIEYAVTEETDPAGNYLWVRKFVDGQKYTGLIKLHPWSRIPECIAGWAVSAER